MIRSEEKPATGKANSKFNIVLFFMLIILIAGLAFVIYIKSQGVDIKNVRLEEYISGLFPSNKNDSEGQEQRIRELDYDGRERPSFSVLKQYIIKCTREHIIMLDKDGNQVWTRSIQMDKPIVKTNGSEAVVADVGGMDIYVLQAKGVKWEARSEGKIVNADISKEGFVTVIEEAKGFRGRVRVYDPLGIEMFNRSIAERFILSAKVSPSSKQLLISGIDLSGIASSSSIEITDMKGEPFSARILRENEVFPSVWYMNDNSILALNSNMAIYLDKDREEKWSKNFKKIYSSNILLGKYLVVGAENENKTRYGNVDSVIIIYDGKGNEIASCKIDGKIFNIQTCDDVIAVNTTREIYFVNSKGKILDKYSSKSDISDLCFFNKNEILVVSKNKLIIINIEGD
ncbi:MAG TPA: hypothetical protein GXX20_05775 [Clostridiaceae bacterium]|nr:hypothetical protein [Clostridiaceae bacterium]